MSKGIYAIFIFIFISCKSAPNLAHQKNHSAEEWAMLGFEKADDANPILEPSEEQKFNCPISKRDVKWEQRNVLNPSAVVKDGQVHLIYRAQDDYMTSRLGLAVSDDGIHFEKRSAPIFYPAEDSMRTYEWMGGVEDPRIVEDENGLYIMTYTSYDGETARLCLATSQNLLDWQKHGLVLGGGKYKDTWSKSGAIVCRQVGEKTIATKVNGKYWMYFGDTDLFMAFSENLIEWEVLEDGESGKMISVLHPRPGYFDSRLVEPGPFALIIEAGILLIYNGSNAANFNDSKLPNFAYAAGQTLFHKDKPYQLIDRMESHFIHPEKSYEKEGEVNEVCFVEGLVFFNQKWLLYYGTADSKIAVAIKRE